MQLRDEESLLPRNSWWIRRAGARPRERAESHYVPATALAFAHAGLAERDDTFALLTRALDVHDHWAVFSLTHFLVRDDLRPDPRFATLRRLIGLIQE